MHIAFYSIGWPPECYPGGINTYIGCLRRELIRRGHRVSIVTKDLAPGCDEPDVHVVPMGFRERVAMHLLEGIGIAPVFSFGLVLGRFVNKLNKRIPIDVFEIEESFGSSLGIKRASGIPVVVKLHGPSFLTEPQEYRSDPFVQKRFAKEGRALARVDAILSPSQSTLRGAIDFYGLQPKIARTVKNPYNIHDPVPLWSARNCSRDTLLFVGRFDRMKGGDTVLLAFKRLLETHRHLKLLFVGPDNGIDIDGRTVHFEEFVERLFSTAERTNLTYLGVLSTARIQELRCKAFVTLISSPWENSPYAALEAMHQACPVVAIDSGGVNEMIEHRVSGLLARPNDLQSLCDQVSALLQESGLGETLGQNARRYVMHHHDPEVIASETLEIYEMAIASNHGVSRFADH